MASYKLSAALRGHEDDVRAVTFVTPQAVASASRDGNVRFWKLTSSNPPTYDDSIAFHSSAFVNSVAYLPATKDYQDGLIISGGKDTIIDVRQPGQPPESDAERLLLGHQGNVCSLDVSPNLEHPYLVSGSWDASARIWNINKGESTATLEGHEGSVWAVLAYDGERVITGCADKVIRVFSTTGKLLRTIKGSTDVVRALCRLPTSSPAQFASAGNDSIIRLWTLEGTEVAQLHGHENFIYSLAALPNGDLISAGEDRTVRVWQGTNCIQTITHPAISVWSVAVCPENGDIVSGASDKVVRVFSKSADRQADAESVKAFEDSVKESSIPKQQMDDLNPEKLPGPDFLQRKSGTKEGQVQLIKEANGSVSAHQWSTAANQWVSVGTVTDSVGSTGKKTEYMGKEYDYVFDVDIEDGKPALKLPYSLSQNPYEVAQKFIGDNELPISYIDQVANFIITNTQGVATIGQQAPTHDAWGTGSRYRPGDDTQQQQGPPPARPKVLPQTSYLTIKSASFSIIAKKISELNSQLLTDGRKDVSFSPSDLQALPSIIQQLETALNNDTPTSNQQLTTGLDFAVKIITTWPSDKRIPGLDLFRCIAAGTPAIADTSRHDLLSVLDASGAFSGGNANPAMLAIRALANLFAHPEGRKLAASQIDKIIAIVQPYMTSGASPVGNNRNVMVAATTLYINYAVLLTTTTEVSEPQKYAAPLLKDTLALLQDAKVTDSETIYRALVAAGTFVAVKGVQIEKGLVTTAVQRAMAGAKEPRIKSVGDEVLALIK